MEWAGWMERRGASTASMPRPGCAPRMRQERPHGIVSTLHVIDKMMNTYLDGHDALFGDAVVADAVEHTVRLGGVFEEFAEIVA